MSEPVRPLFFNDADEHVGARVDTSKPTKRTTGILPYQALREMERSGAIAAVEKITPEQIQPASIDLRLGHQAYRVSASFLPGRNSTVMNKIRQLDGYPVDLSNGAVLEKGCVYVVQLQEALKLAGNIVGFANPKSSTGRLDVLTRLITDRSTSFDQIDAGYSGSLFVEIAPRTFSVVVKRGSRLNQLRFQRGSAVVPASELTSRYEQGELTGSPGQQNRIENGLVPVTIDLKGTGLNPLIGYRAKKNTDRIDLEKIHHYDPHDFWEPIYHHRDAELILNPDDFYILATCEEVRIPPQFAAEMVPYHTRSGEYRVHYAGFFDPGFGWDMSRGGSRAVLEVRSHEVPFVLEHGQTVGWLRYEWMAGQPDRIYGPSIGSSYQSQGLALAKQFRPFEESI